MKVSDPLYGEYELPFDALLEHWSVRRSHGLGMSGVPTWWINNHEGQSRYDHECGAALLTRVLLDANGMKDRDLEIAAFLHDNGHLAFPHAGQRAVPGYSHEQRAAAFCQEEGLAKLITACGGVPDRVVALINGNDHNGQLVNGSIDVDNIDNTQRYALTVGILSRLRYDGVALAAAFRITPTGWALDPAVEPLLEYWQEVRQVTYDFIHSEWHLGRAALIHKALAAYKEAEGQERTQVLLDGVDLTAAAQLMNHPSSEFYTRILNRHERLFHVGDVTWPAYDAQDGHTLTEDDILSRTATHLRTEKAYVLSAGPTQNRNKKGITFTDGRTFDKTTTILHGLRRVYSVYPVYRELDLDAMNIKKKEEK